MTIPLDSTHDKERFMTALGSSLKQLKTGCLHRMTFLSRYAAKAAVSRSRVVDAYWLCPQCNFWVAGNYEDAPVEALTSEIGIFTSNLNTPTP